MEKRSALRSADIDAWIHPADPASIEVQLRDDFLAWAAGRPEDLRFIRDGSSLFREFLGELCKTPEGQIRLLKAQRRKYEAAYEANSRFPGWSREKNLQMMQRIDQQIEQLMNRQSA
jgi:hypothetical protein